MEYISIGIRSHRTGEELFAFQEIKNSTVTRYCNIDTGETLDMESLGLYDSWVIDTNPPFPEWGIIDSDPTPTDEVLPPPDFIDG